MKRIMTVLMIAALISSTAMAGEEYVTRQGNYPVTAYKHQLVKMLKYAEQNDVEAGSKEMLQNPDVAFLREGMTVYVMDTAYQGYLVEIRRRGDRSTAWTLGEALRKKY